MNLLAILKDNTVQIVSQYDLIYHNLKLQTNLWHREEEPYNNQETPGRQT